MKPPPQLLIFLATALSQLTVRVAARPSDNMLLPEDGPLDFATLALLSDAADSQVATVLTNKNVSLKGSPRSLCREVRRLVTPFVWPNSHYFHDQSLVPVIDEMLDKLAQVQHKDGTYSVGNRHSPPDTGFLIEDFGIMARLLDSDDHDKSAHWEMAIRNILIKAGDGLAKGGIHTPNHRWKVSAALARISRIIGENDLIGRIDEWLSEGIDIDRDGIYSERSANYFSAVSNPSLLTVAQELNRPELIDHVRQNLEATILLATTEGETETIQSRRQDQAQDPQFITPFYPQFRELAIRDKNGRFAAMARFIEDNFASELGDYFGTFLERPELLVELPEAENPFVDFRKHFADASLVRERRGKLTVSTFGGTDFYDKDGKPTEFFNTFGSGLSTNPTFFRAWNGQAVLEAVRLVPNFFSMGHFRSAGLKYDQNSGTTRLQQEVHVPYYLPIPADLRDKGGDYKLSKSVDGRFFSKLDFANRPTDLRHLRTNITIEPTEGGYDLTFQVDGEEEVEMTLELTFRTGGRLEGPEEAEDEEGNAVYHLKEGMGKYTVGSDSVSFGPGNGDGLIMAAPGEQYSWLKGNLKLEGERVYITGMTPMTYTLRLGFS
ncbi:hypothetical protein NLU13_8922 [Sarocladium strictum]|uniref:Uncharacterized protein n=1 Tax=Sarocladium strictum TaxID=5046 RepID=A0AA39G9P0_SARSR|nr:hypothetical protein NLU13_8922 [Sarocladium strictum]